MVSLSSNCLQGMGPLCITAPLHTAPSYDSPDMDFTEQNQGVRSIIAGAISQRLTVVAILIGVNEPRRAIPQALEKLRNFLSTETNAKILDYQTFILSTFASLSLTRSFTAHFFLPMTLSRLHSPSEAFMREASVTKQETRYRLDGQTEVPSKDVVTLRFRFSVTP